MTNALIPLSSNLVNVREQIVSLGGKPYALNEAGRALMPFKAEMLYGLDAVTAANVYEAVALLFSASMKYVDAQVKERAARQHRDSVGIIEARLQRGLAEGAAIALCEGPPRNFIVTAIEQAPIPTYAIINIAPELQITSRLAVWQRLR